MTRAPENLLAVRRLLLKHLDIDPTRGRSIDLESAEVGIVGDTAHVKQGNSYHLGLPEQSRTGYAATESSRDTAGLSEDASALDIGEFTVSVRGRSYNLRHFSAWLVGQCAAGAPDTRDIREVIYSPDGVTVKRWDRLGRRSTGDSSHRTHTHISYFRDATKAGRDQTAVYRRYLTSIGIMEERMTMVDLTQAAIDAVGSRAWSVTYANGTETPMSRLLQIRDHAENADSQAMYALAGVNRLEIAVARAEATLAEILGRDWVNEQEIVSGVLAGLGSQPAKQVASALVAAGINPTALRDALNAHIEQPV